MVTVNLSVEEAVELRSLLGAGLDGWDDGRGRELCRQVHGKLSDALGLPGRGE